MKKRVILLSFALVTMFIVWLNIHRAKVTKLSSFVVHNLRDSPDLDVEEQQKERQRVLTNSCRRLNMNRPQNSNTDDIKYLLKHVKLFHSDKHKLIVCEIPKCGCTSVKKILLVAEGLVNATDPEDVDSGKAHSIGNAKLDLVKLNSMEDIVEKMKSYYKLIIVRDPLYRLLSAYRDKMEIQNAWSGYLFDLSKKIHTKYSNDSKPASFYEFLSYVVESDDCHFDRHWEMYHKLCNPCSISYDFIAHIETINDDIPYVLKKVKITDSNSFPKNKPDSKRTDYEKLKKYLETVPKNLLDEIYKTYQTDYELFGFSKP